MKPIERLTQISDTWHEFFKLYHTSLEQIMEPEEGTDPQQVFQEGITEATALSDRLDSILDELRTAL